MSLLYSCVCVWGGGGGMHIIVLSSKVEVQNKKFVIFGQLKMYEIQSTTLKITNDTGIFLTAFLFAVIFLLLLSSWFVVNV